MKWGDPGARVVGARVGIGVVVYLHLVAARVAWAQDNRMPVPWPTSPSEVVPAGTPLSARKTAPSALPTPAAPGSPAIATPPTAAAPPPSAGPTAVPVTPAPEPPAPASAPSQPTLAVESTHVGAIGNGLALIDRNGDATWELERLMAVLTHRPTGWLRFHAEAGLENGATFAAQQVLVELTATPAFGLRAGLMLLPHGIINQLNAPTTYLTVDRPLTDLLIIPTFWRELGAGIFGEVGGALRYQLDVVRGLDGAGFSAQAPLAGGRSNGFGGGTTGAALTARLELFGASDGFVMGGSGYYGSASGGQAALDGVTVGIAEGDARFRGGGVELRAELAQVFIFNSYRVNDYLGLLGQDAVPKAGRGAYVQVGYDVLRLGDVDTRQELLFFAAYENVNPRSAMSPYNYNPPTITGPGELAPNAPSPSRSFVRGGIAYRPLPELVFKVDLQIALDGEAPPLTAPVTAAAAPGTPRPLTPQLAEAARGKSRVGLAVGFAF